MLASQQSTRKVEAAVEELIIRSSATEFQQLGISCLLHSHITARPPVLSNWAGKVLQPLSAHSSWKVLFGVQDLRLCMKLISSQTYSLRYLPPSHLPPKTQPHKIMEEQAALPADAVVQEPNGVRDATLQAVARPGVPCSGPDWHPGAVDLIATRGHVASYVCLSLSDGSPFQKGCAARGFSAPVHVVFAFFTDHSRLVTL